MEVETLVDWDTAIALGYAAEQLFVAAQALTSDLVSKEQGLQAADTRVVALLDNEQFLPTRIRDRLRRLHESYAKGGTRRLDEAAAHDLSQQTMRLLREVRDVLAWIESQRLAA
jgi:DNA-binding NarL/FixJ family response regulator